MSLLDQIKKQPVARKHARSEADPQMIEVAIAFCKHDVTLSQVAKQLGINENKAMTRIHQTIISAIRTGELS